MKEFHLKSLFLLFSCNKGTSSPSVCLASRVNDLSAFVFEHLSLSAEKEATDRSFYTKMNLCALGVKVTNLQGPAEKGCASMPRSPLAEDDLVEFGADQHLTGFIPSTAVVRDKTCPHM